MAPLKAFLAELVGVEIGNFRSGPKGRRSKVYHSAGIGNGASLTPKGGEDQKEGGCDGFFHKGLVKEIITSDGNSDNQLSNTGNPLLCCATKAQKRPGE